MKHHSILRSWPVVACLLIASLSLFAQGTAFTYQGRVRSGGSDFTGTGQFKFALVTSSNGNANATATANLSGAFVTSYTVTGGGNGYLVAPAVSISGGGGSGATATANVSGGVVTSLSPGNAGSGYTSPPTVTIGAPPANISYTTYWSNDGTSSAGSEPSAAVSVSVANGLFTVVLGDTRLANMAALTAALFAQPNLQLRIWFNDGLNGFAVLNPPQDLTPTPYAISAHSASNLLGLLPASQLSGLVSLGQVPAALLTNNQSGVNLTGSFTGNGGGLTELWRMSGNAGTTPSAHFLGTTDNQPLELKVNGRRALRLENNGDGAPNVIGGSPVNFVSAGVVGATIGGGGATNYAGLAYTNKVTGNFGTVVGGRANTASGFASTAMGDNTTASGDYAAAMGYGNTAEGSGSTAMGFYARARGDYSTAMGAFTTASGNWSTAMGYDTTASNLFSTAMGRSTMASGAYSTAMGDNTTASGDSSTAMGSQAKAIHNGSFVWADAQEAEFTSTATNQFSIRAAGGVRFNSGSSLFMGGNLGQKINLYTTTFGIGIQSGIQYYRVATGGYHVWYAGGVHNDNAFQSPGGSVLMQLGGGGMIVFGTIYATGTITPNSDRNAKTDFAPVDTASILDRVTKLPIQQWRFKSEADGVKHVGPMAQDFHAAFGLGTGEKHIATVDADGVALAAIQGLNQKVEEKDAEIRNLRTRLEKLEQILTGQLQTVEDKQP